VTKTTATWQISEQLTSSNSKKAKAGPRNEVIDFPTFFMKQ
jgi:hypothetical protein